MIIVLYQTKLIIMAQYQSIAVQHSHVEVVEMLLATQVVNCNDLCL